MISIQNVSKKYPKSTQNEWALQKINLEIKSGEFVAIVGTSGSGKTTLLNLIGILDHSFEGDLSIDGQSLKSLSDAQRSAIRNQKIGFVFQHFSLLDHLTALENVLLPLAFQRDTNLSQAEGKTRAIALLDRLGLKDKMNARPVNLSGGQKQRVAIARALLFNPQILLCDEPTGSLDKHTGQQIIDIFKELHKEGFTIVVITHENRVSEVAQRIVRLEDGRVVQDEIHSQNQDSQNQDSQNQDSQNQESSL
jgi:putative ABC transport system ATP-binding protein